MWKPPEPPFVLDAITLRGVGSYLHGARLDIKPLTVLCGANGSGKSTWLKALNLLSESLAANRLPYGFSVQDWDHANIQVTNAFCHLEDPAQLAALEDDAATAAYGAMGTIGLEFHSTENMRLFYNESIADLSNDEDAAAAWQFFNKGTIQSKDRFRLRLAYPTHRDDSAATPTLRHVVELQYNDRHTIRMEGERDPFQKYEDGYTRPRRSKPLTLSCSRSFLTGNDADAGECIPLAIFHDLNSPTLESLTNVVDDNTIGALLHRFEDVIRDMLRHVLGGFFYIGAIRPPMRAVSVGGVERYGESDRHVGASGENAWSIASGLQKQLMRTIVKTVFAAPELRWASWVAWYYELQRLNASTDEEISKFRSTYSGSKFEHVYYKLPAGVREQIESCAVSLGPDDDMDDGFELTRQSLADAFNELLDDRSLLDYDLWATEVADPSDEEDADDDAEMEFEIPDADIRELASRVMELPPADLRILNYLLILDAFLFRTSSSCSGEEYLSSWLTRLVEVGLNPPTKPSDDWHRSQVFFGKDIIRPTPYLANSRWLHGREEALGRLDHPCFGGEKGTLQVPRQMSSGFHQLFPILVQLGVMKSGELIGIENPEVHLHPALQVSMTEALLDHAVSGRRMIVETHSDLLLRRVIRAILSEEISQSQVQIYFTKLGPIAHEGAAGEFSESTLEPIRTDSRGRISNWPEGFLDADVRESQQLMDIMYGGSDQEEPDDGTD